MKRELKFWTSYDLNCPSVDSEEASQQKNDLKIVSDARWQSPLTEPITRSHLDVDTLCVSPDRAPCTRNGADHVQMEIDPGRSVEICSASATH